MIKRGLSFFRKIVSVAGKLFIVIAVFVTVINLFLILSKTDRNTPLGQNIDPFEAQRAQMYSVVNDPKYNTPTGKVTVNIYRGFMCMATGELCTDNPKDGDKNFDHSLFGGLSSLIVMPYMNPPASGIAYIQDRLQDSGFISPAYAYEGIGFSSIKGYIKIWNLFRNLTYLILVLIIISIGFMIMFRMKLNPQTVISIENSLPRIVVALILITFSFAIAGFMIDIMYVVFGLIIYTFSQLNVGILTPSNLLNLQNKYIGAGMNEIWPENGLGSAIATGGAMFTLLPQIVRVVLRLFAGWVIGLSLARAIIKFSPTGKIASALDGIGITAASFGFQLGNKTVSNWIAIPLESLLFAILFNWMPALIIGILITFTIAFLVFKIFFILITSYIKIILFIIFAPIILLFEAIPGKDVFSFWMKSLIGELIAFPLVLVISLSGYAIITINTAGQGFSLPFIQGFSSKEFGVIVGLGIILIIPDIVKMVKGLMGLKDLPVNFGINTFFGGVSAPVGGGVGILSQYGMLAMHMPALKKLPLAIPGLRSLFESEQEKLERIGKIPGSAAAKPPDPLASPLGGAGGSAGGTGGHAP